jgi:enoyl-CoA hydratase/long-chain 3-hydroxyacyl-CoA dehydrogenase
LTNDSPNLEKHFGNTDMVIEAVFEDLDLKKKIVADIENLTPDHCIFATNTSAIPISAIAEGSKRPENIVGMHYFSPVPSMPLLEIIPHEGTCDTATATAFDVGTKQGKTCIVVKDVPGFYVNRCLGPFLVEVSALVCDGVSLEQLDKTVRDFGMPVGPVTLADEVGIDVTSHVATFLSNADMGVRMDGGNIALMENMIGKGWLGKKSGQGFYTYDKKKKGKTISPDVRAYVKEFVEQDLKLDKDEIQNRIISRLVNEAAKCLEDEIIADPVVGDIGLVFGTGFAPFRGGPFRYLDQIGVAGYVDMMHLFADKYGPQFEPCQLLKDYAASDKKFYTDS